MDNAVEYQQRDLAQNVLMSATAALNNISTHSKTTETSDG